jgi:hypothetical protein
MAGEDRDGSGMAVEFMAQSPVFLGKLFWESRNDGENRALPILTKTEVSLARYVFRWITGW